MTRGIKTMTVLRYKHESRVSCESTICLNRLLHLTQYGLCPIQVYQVRSVRPKRLPNPDCIDGPKRQPRRAGARHFMKRGGVYFHVMIGWSDQTTMSW